MKNTKVNEKVLVYLALKEWYKNGLLHREDGPAVVKADGTKEWYLNGKFHRVDGPAIERVNGDREWYRHGQCHREDGPAIEHADGEKAWLINDGYHREDGPAIEWANGDKMWCLLGEEVSANLVLALKYREQMPDEVFLALIEEQTNTEIRGLMIERYGWQKYLVDSQAKLLDSRDNAIENTKEALFAAGELGNRLVVTCPTGRVFVLGVPKSRKTCEAAQKWLGKADKKINVIGRT